MSRLATMRSAVARVTPARIGMIGAGIGAVAVVALMLSGGKERKPVAEPATTAPRAEAEPFELAPPRAAPPAQTASAEPPPARFTVVPQAVDLLAGGRTSVIVRNDGGSFGSVSDIVATGGAATAAGSCADLAAGASCRIEVLGETAGGGEIIGVGAGGVILRIPYRVSAPPERTPPPERDRFAELVDAARAEHAAGLARGRLVDGAAPRSDGRLSRGALASAQTASPASATAGSYGDAFPRVVSSLPVDLSRTVLQDTPIPLVLSRSINSQIAGPVTAMVERDVYGGDGTTVVIPAGSTLHGRYEGMRRGETRLRTEFTRLVRAGDNAHFDLRAHPATGADLMGRVGLVDDLDERGPERYGGAIVAGALEIAGSVIEEMLSAPARQGNQAGGDGRTVVVAGTQANRSTQSIAKMMLERNLDLAPVHTIHGGYQFLVSPSIDLWLAPPGRGRPRDAAGAGVRSSGSPETRGGPVNGTVAPATGTVMR